jgi:hypothetical protein
VTGETVAVGWAVTELFSALGVGAGVADGHVRNGVADTGQGGAVRIRGGSSGEQWRSGPVRSLMAGVLRRAGPADGAGQSVDYGVLRIWASTASSSPAALVSMSRSDPRRGDRRLGGPAGGRVRCGAGSGEPG